MRTIWKFLIPGFGFKLNIPDGGKILYAGIQQHEPQMWVEVDDQLDMEERNFEVLGTGHLIVWHLYEVWE